MIHALAHALTARLRFLTMSNIVLVSFTLYRTSSLLILSTQLIFSILLQIHISMASNLFLSVWVIVYVSDAYNTTLHNPLSVYYSLCQLCTQTACEQFLFIHKHLFTQCNPTTYLSPILPLCWNNTSWVFELVNLLYLLTINTDPNSVVPLTWNTHDFCLFSINLHIVFFDTLLILSIKYCSTLWLLATTALSSAYLFNDTVASPTDIISCTFSVASLVIASS